MQGIRADNGSVVMVGRRRTPEQVWRRQQLWITRSLCVLAACLCAGTVSAGTETPVLVSGRDQKVTVVVPAEPAPELAEAAAELSRYVEKLCGVALPVRADGEAVAGNRGQYGAVSGGRLKQN